MQVCIEKIDPPLVAYDHESGLRLETGSALAVKDWAWQLTHPNGDVLPSEVPYANQDLLIESVKESLEAGKKNSSRSPKVLVIGAVSRMALVLQIMRLLTLSSLDAAATAPCSSPRMSGFLNLISSSGILPRPRRVGCTWFDLTSHLALTLFQAVLSRRLSRMLTSLLTASTCRPRSLRSSTWKRFRLRTAGCQSFAT